MFSVNFPENASKQQKILVKLLIAHFEEKNIFFLFLPFYWFDHKHLFKQIIIFLMICPFWNMLKKISEYFCAL